MTNHQTTNKSVVSHRPGSAMVIPLLFFLVIFTAPGSLAAGTSSSPSMEFSVNGVDTDVYGSGGTGYTGEDVRQSDSHLTGGAGDRAMEVESTANYTSNQKVTRNDIPDAGTPTTSNDPRRVTQYTQLDKVFGGTKPQGLPPTTLDSFVVQAGGMREVIYGDEGTGIGGILGLPPQNYFLEQNRINTGIHSDKLTTGHKDSSLPEAWDWPN